MNHLTVIAVDLVAISLLSFAIYFPRHRRRDLVVAYLGVNAGVVAVSAILGSATVGAGLGLGLFGVLSIIRLRSREIEQYEIAYYFAALALGLVAGLSTTLTWLTVGLMALILVVMYLADHPRLFRRYDQQLVQLGRAIGIESELIAELEVLLNARIHRVKTEKLDQVNDTTLVDVRFERLPEGQFARPITTPQPEHAGGAA